MTREVLNSGDSRNVLGARSIQANIEDPRVADVGNLENELSALWRATDENRSNEHGVTRACALTLITSASSEQDAERVSELVSEVTRQNPCRALVFVAEPETTRTGLSAWILAHCHVPAAGEKQVCSEQVTIVARGKDVGALGNLITPLVVPGLPVYLWWRAPDVGFPGYLGDILRITRRVIVNSGAIENVGSGLQALAGLILQYSGEIAFSDLNWGRLTSWREVMAQCFDSPDAAPSIGHVDRVRFEFEADSPRLHTQKSQALLMTGWLATRFGWRLLSTRLEDGGARRVIRFGRATGEVDVEHVARKMKDGGAGVFFSVEMHASGAAGGRFRLERVCGSKWVTTRRELAGRPSLERRARLEVLTETELLNEELKYLGRDRIYEDAVEVAARIAQG